MFGTPIHWTTFFYVLIDTCIIFIAFFNHKAVIDKQRHKRFLNLGSLFIVFNLAGGFLPIEDFPGPLILQHSVIYGIGIVLCIYVIYYLYKDFGISSLNYRFSIPNLILLAGACFLLLFLVPYFITNSLKTGKVLFTIPTAVIAFLLLLMFYKQTSYPFQQNYLNLRRRKLSLISLSSIALLPILTVIGDYQWLTFSNMNIGFYAIICIEIDRYRYYLENKHKISGNYILRGNRRRHALKPKIIYQNLTTRQTEIVFLILERFTYKEIGEKLNIAEKTVSKHASNIFKKTNVAGRVQFMEKFDKDELSI